MFARIVLDSKTVEQALTIPTGAVVEIEGKSGVFVPGRSPRSTSISSTPSRSGVKRASLRVVRSG